jgi:hypothetical protein
MVSILLPSNIIKKPNYVGKLDLKKLGVFKRSGADACREYYTYTDTDTDLKANYPPLMQCRNEHSTANSHTTYSQLGSYLAGLIEGDGNIYIPGKGVKGQPQIEIVFDIRDLELFKKIYSVIGGGTFYFRPNNKSGKITFKKTEYLLKVLLLINGHMRTPKIEALHRLIIWFNLKHNTNIPLLCIDQTPLKDSSWLSGILEADAPQGSFYFTWKLNKNDMPIGIIYYLRLSQKQTYTRKLDPSVNVSNLFFMKEIAEFLKTEVTSLERDRGYFIEKAYSIRTHKLESKLQLFDYLSKYPLFGYKYLDQMYLDKVHNLYLNNEHKTLDGKNKLIKYTNFMKKDDNKKYTWEHLHNFYSN